MQNWLFEPHAMREALEAARKLEHTRLFALAYFPDTPLQWQSKKDEAEMQAFLDSRERSESTIFNCAIAIVVVNPADTDETIEALIAGKQKRQGTGPGYFEEAFW